MFEVGFSELLLISVIALIVLGPERLPKLVSQVGRWVGKARSMARTFREQLESEVNLEELTRTPTQAPVTPTYPPPGEAPPNEVDAAAQSDALAPAPLTPEEQHAVDTQHHDTPDYPYAAPTESVSTAETSHPEGDVYGGSAPAAPERILSDDEPTPTADATTEPEPARLHDERA